MSRPDPIASKTSRRALLAGVAGASVVGLSATSRSAQAAAQVSEKAVKNGRIKQSLVHWCYAPHFDVPTMIKVARAGLTHRFQRWPAL